MTTHANPTVIGGFVLGALALVVAAILVFSSGAWLKQRVAMVTYFPGSVQGLSVGAQVQFQGVQVGEVTAIGLDYVVADRSFRIPVYYDIWPESIGLVGVDAPALGPEDFAKRLVEERGLRARLEPVSLVTGQYMVSLGMGTSRPPQYLGGSGRRIEIPAIESTRDRVMDMLDKASLDELLAGATGTLEALKSLLDSRAIQTLIGHLDDTVLRVGKLSENIDSEIKPLGEQLSRTLGHYETLADTLGARATTVADGLEATAADMGRLSRHLDAKIGPLTAAATAAVRQADQTLETVHGVLAEGSDLRYSLHVLLKEASGAARSLRDLADYLERHPEALVQGKR